MIALATAVAAHRPCPCGKDFDGFPHCVCGWSDDSHETLWADHAADAITGELRAWPIPEDAATPTKFKIYYCHQVPGPSWEQEVDSPEIGQKILDAIYQVALYQFHYNMIPDYANASGIVYLDDAGEWCDYDPEDWT